MNNTNINALFEQEPRAAGCALHENIICLYGQPKIGKTTLASQFPDVLFLTTEPGTKHVAVREIAVRSWQEFLLALKGIEQAVRDAVPIKTVCIDTIDNLMDSCEEFTCSKMSDKLGERVEVLADVPYGRAYGSNTREFTKRIKALSMLGLGLIFISHAQEKEVAADTITNPYAAARSDEDGNVVMFHPTMSKQARKVILGLSDMILFAQILKSQERVLHAKPTIRFEAGDRSGRLPQTFPLSYAALVNAYYGEAGDEIRQRIQTAHVYLDGKGIKYEKHDITDMNNVQMEAYLQGLRLAAKRKKGNEE